ncbi:hypothetical protein [Nonomuraea dietziae]|uniref:hypothetical protein n=1 Tax=Nonomuraea dietziae TaxID=65515 RepID=UPI00340F0307
MDRSKRVPCSLHGAPERGLRGRGGDGDRQGRSRWNDRLRHSQEANRAIAAPARPDSAIAGSEGPLRATFVLSAAQARSKVAGCLARQACRLTGVPPSSRMPCAEATEGSNTLIAEIISAWRGGAKQYTMSASLGPEQPVRATSVESVTTHRGTATGGPYPCERPSRHPRPGPSPTTLTRPATSSCRHPEHE